MAFNNNVNDWCILCLVIGEILKLILLFLQCICCHCRLSARRLSVHEILSRCEGPISDTELPFLARFRCLTGGESANVCLFVCSFALRRRCINDMASRPQLMLAMNWASPCKCGYDGWLTRPQLGWKSRTISSVS